MRHACFNLGETDLGLLYALARVHEQSFGDLMRSAVKEYLERRQPEAEAALALVTEEQRKALDRLFGKL